VDREDEFDLALPALRRPMDSAVGEERQYRQGNEIEVRFRDITDLWDVVATPAGRAWHHGAGRAVRSWIGIRW
jgi:hypothetical protein